MPVADAELLLAYYPSRKREQLLSRSGGFNGGVRRTLANLTMGLTVVAQVISFLRDRKGSRK